MLILGPTPVLFFPSGVSDPANSCSTVPFQAMPLIRTAAIAGAGTARWARAQILSCLEAVRLLRSLVNMQASWKRELAGKHALYQQLRVQVEADTANMVLYTDDARREGSLAACFHFKSFKWLGRQVELC